jgi:hypothetical protein
VGINWWAWKICKNAPLRKKGETLGSIKGLSVPLPTVCEIADWPEATTVRSLTQFSFELASVYRFIGETKRLRLELAGHLWPFFTGHQGKDVNENQHCFTTADASRTNANTGRPGRVRTK